MVTGENVPEAGATPPVDDPPSHDITEEMTLPPTPTPLRTKPQKEFPKSRIPVPASVYLGVADRSGYLADLCEEIYVVDDKEKEKERRRRRRRRGRSESEESEDSDRSEVDDYGPPGILHEKRRKDKKKHLRRSSSELGDSSIELLGPSETLDTDESDGSEELLEDGERGGRRRRAGSAYHRYPEKRGHKKISKSKTVGDEDEDPKKPGRPASSKDAKSVDKLEGEEAEQMHPRLALAMGRMGALGQFGKFGKFGATAAAATAAPKGGMDKWRVAVPQKGAKGKLDGKLPISEGAGDEMEVKLITGPIPPKEGVSLPKSPETLPDDISPEKKDMKMREEAVRDATAGIRLLQLCQDCDWYGADGHVRYFEKRIRSGIMIDPKPLADVKDEVSGWTPLMYAVKDNRIPLCERLIELGCDVNGMSKDGFYPIHIAALFGREETIRFLIYRRAEITSLTDKENQSVIHLACTRRTGNNSAILRTLLCLMPPDARMEKDANGNIPIFLALEHGLRGACQELLAVQAQEQLQATTGELNETPLHIATRKKDLEICRILTDAGADVNKQNVSLKIEKKFTKYFLHTKMDTFFKTFACVHNYNFRKLVRHPSTWLPSWEMRIYANSFIFVKRIPI